MSAMNMMTLDDFEALAMAYGSDLARWPENERADAETLLATSDRAQDMLREAAALDATLDLWDDPTPSQDLMARVLEDAASVATNAAVVAPALPTAARKGWRGWLPDLTSQRLGGRRPAFALAACLAVGFSLGMNLDGSVLQPPAQEVSNNEIEATDFIFAMEDDSDLLLGPEVFL